jgi:hypothetical protein
MPLGARNGDTHLNEDYLSGVEMEGDYPLAEDMNGVDMEGLLEGRMSTKLRDGVISQNQG